MSKQRDLASIRRISEHVGLGRDRTSAMLRGLKPDASRKVRGRLEHQWNLQRATQHIIGEIEAQRLADDPGVKQERRRLLSAQADRQELQAARERGQLGRIDDFQQAVQTILAGVVLQLQRIPGLSNELAAITVPGLVRRKLQERIAEIRNDAAQRIEEYGRDWQRGIPTGLDGPIDDDERGTNE